MGTDGESGGALKPETRRINSRRDLSTRTFSLFHLTAKKRGRSSPEVERPKRSFLCREIRASAACHTTLIFAIPPSKRSTHLSEPPTFQRHADFPGQPGSLPSNSSERSSLMRDLGPEVPRPNQIPIHFTDTTSPLPLPFPSPPGPLR